MATEKELECNCLAVASSRFFVITEWTKDIKLRENGWFGRTSEFSIQFCDEIYAIGSQIMGSWLYLEYRWVQGLHFSYYVCTMFPYYKVITNHMDVSERLIDLNMHPDCIIREIYLKTIQSYFHKKKKFGHFHFNSPLYALSKQLSPSPFPHRPSLFLTDALVFPSTLTLLFSVQ